MNALQMKDGRAFYELTADRIAMLFTIRRSGKKIEVRAVMKPYTTDDVIEFLQAREIIRRPVKEERGATDLELESYEADAPFFDRHVLSVELLGTQLTKDQVDRLDYSDSFKSAVFLHGLNGIHSDIEDAEESDNALTFEDVFAPGRKVEQYTYLADETWKEHRVNVAHQFRETSAADSLEYKKSLRARTLVGGIQKAHHNYRRVEKLYNSMITSLVGFTLDGQTCAEANKAEWLPRVPYLFKLFAVHQHFRNTERKNG